MGTSEGYLPLLYLPYLPVVIYIAFNVESWGDEEEWVHSPTMVIQG